MSASPDRESHILAANLHPFNLSIAHIQGDGNCFFRAISHQLYGHEDSHAELRLQCIAHIEAERDYYANFVEGESFENYIKRMRKPGSWADNIEINALAELLEARIEIYVVDSKPIVIYGHHAKPERIIRLFYKNRNHYDSIVESSADKSVYDVMHAEHESHHSVMHTHNRIFSRSNLSMTKGFSVDHIINRSISFYEKEEVKRLNNVTIESEKTDIEDDIMRLIKEESRAEKQPQGTLMENLTNLGFSKEMAMQAVLTFGDDEQDVEKVLTKIYD